MRIRGQISLKRKQLRARSQPSAPSPPPRREVIPVTEQGATVARTRQIEISLNQPEPEQEMNLVVAGLFNSEEFQAKWEEKAKQLFPKARDVLATLYAFGDVLQSIEEGLVSGTDPKAQLVDSKLSEELTALANYKLLLIFAADLFDSDDLARVRDFLLTPEAPDALRKAATSGQSPSDVIRSLYEDMKRRQAGLPSGPITEERPPPGMVGRSKTTSR